MPTLLERLETAVVTEEANAAKALAIIQGPASGGSSLVSTANGDVKTLARVVAEAVAALDAAVDDLEESATTSAAAALASQIAAAASETAAATSATNSATSASSAATSATTASTAATNAGNSATAAAGSASAAATSATSAGTSATTAATQATNASTSASNASTSATLAADWATKTNAIVAATDYSAKEFAIGIQAGTGGSAKNWAQQTGADVTGATANSRSAKSWAQDNLTGATLQGSAKDWAQSASLPDGTNKSAKSYSIDASTSASAAAASAATAASIAAGLNFKGSQAGATVPATSTTAGDCYTISSAGTSQSITWAAGDLAIYKGTSGQWTQIPAAVVAGISAALRNALDTRPAVILDGTTNSFNWNGPLGSQAPGVDDLGVYMVVDVPPANPAAIRMLWELGGSSLTGGIGNSLSAAIQTDGSVHFAWRNAANTGRLARGISNLVSSYGGKRVHLLYTRTGVTDALYINGVAVALSTLADDSGGTTVANNLTGATYYRIGCGFNSTWSYVGHVYQWSMFNMCPNATDAIELYELGGEIPGRLQWGSQVGLTMPANASTFDSGVSVWANNTGSPTITWDGTNFRMGVTAPGSGQIYAHQVAGAMNFKLGAHWRMKFDLKTLAAGGPIQFGPMYGGTFTLGNGSAAGVADNVSADFRGIPDTGAYANGGGLTFGWTGAVDFSVDNIRLYRTGCTVHLRAENLNCRQCFDASTNKCHSLLSHYGATAVRETDDFKYSQLALTANGEFLDVSGVFRTDCLLVDVVVRNTTANIVYGFALGSASGGDQLTYRTDIPANGYVVLPIKLAELQGLTVGVAPYGRAYYSATSWNSGSLNIAIRYRRERDL